MTTPPEIPITQSPRRVSHPTVSLRANPPTQAPSLNRSKTVSISVSPWVLFQSFTLEYLPKLHTRSGNRVFPNYSLPNPSLLSTPCFLHLRRWRSWSIVDPIWIYVVPTWRKHASGDATTFSWRRTKRRWLAVDRRFLPRRLFRRRLLLPLWNRPTSTEWIPQQPLPWRTTFFQYAVAGREGRPHSSVYRE